MINLGLNRKISNVLSKNLNDPESDIYKEISSIAGETTESDSSVNNPFGINIAECIEENKEPFDDCDLESIEELYLLDTKNISNLPMERFTSLKKLMLPNFSHDENFTPPSDNIWYNIISYHINVSIALPIEIMLLGYDVIEHGFIIGTNNTIFSSLNTLILPNCIKMGFSNLGNIPNLENIVFLNKDHVCTHTQGMVSIYNLIYDVPNIFVPDKFVQDYINNNGLTESQVKPLSQLPQEIREELELCQIQI